MGERCFYDTVPDDYDPGLLYYDLRDLRIFRALHGAVFVHGAERLNRSVRFSLEKNRSAP